MDDGNSNISPCKNIIFIKQTKIPELIPYIGLWQRVLKTSKNRLVTVG
jgi:hypothetical protein